MTNQLTVNNPLSPALLTAINLWAKATTDATSARHVDLCRDKTNALVGTSGKHGTLGFFAFRSIPVDSVTPADVRDWQQHMADTELSAASIYARVCRLSSFYEWLMQEPSYRERIGGNPVTLARPKAPKAYQGEKTNALSDAEATALLKVVKAEAQKSLAGKRDYAMLRFFFATGKRRAEIVSLTEGDLDIQANTIVIRTVEKGGLYRSTEVRDAGVRAALLDYLQATGRIDLDGNPVLSGSNPLWLRHDHSTKKVLPVTSHGFVKALDKYAAQAGLGHIHLHQTRHTVARMVGEQSGDMAEVQAVLGHQNLATTRVYLARVAVKKDRHSTAIAARLGIDED